MATLSRKSWHYRLMNRVEYNPESLSFCEYWSRLCFYSFFFFLAGAMAYMIAQGLVLFIGYFAISCFMMDFSNFLSPLNPDTFLGACYMFAILGLLTCIILAIIYGLTELIMHGKKSANRHSDSLFAAKYESVKNQVCPSIDWID
jgi:hypothetical protein